MKTKTVIIIHSLFWFYIINQGLFPLYTGMVSNEGMNTTNVILKDVLFSFFLNLFSFYSVYFSFPALLKLNSRYISIFLGIIIVLGVAIIRAPIDYFLWKYFGNINKEVTFEPSFFWNNFRLVIITGTYSILIRFMIYWYEIQKVKDELINQRQASELALLRSQVNPHFLFNTLNNIYSLVYKKSDEAAPSVMKLSSIMRYMLYDSTTETVPLDKEIDYLKSFIELQLLRIKHQDFVEFKIGGDIGGKSIAPMMLISFVENAFKHGSKSHHPGIIINLTVLSDRVLFQVINFMKKNTLAQDKEDSGIGLSNIKRRLELIYPQKHDLLIYKTEDTFKVDLEIIL